MFQLVNTSGPSHRHVGKMRVRSLTSHTRPHPIPKGVDFDTFNGVVIHDLNTRGDSIRTLLSTMSTSKDTLRSELQPKSNRWTLTEQPR